MFDVYIQGEGSRRARQQRANCLRQLKTGKMKARCHRHRREFLKSRLSFARLNLKSVWHDITGVFVGAREGRCGLNQTDRSELELTNQRLESATRIATSRVTRERERHHDRRCLPTSRTSFRMFRSFQDHFNDATEWTKG
jgi:hypothetical protein